MRNRALNSSSITYLPFGPLNGLTYGNALTFSAGFDQDYNPTSRAVSSIFSDTYDTDQVGNITQRGAVTFDYDALNRLDEEDDGSATTYTYDATHNRLTKVDGSTLSTTVPTTSNKISAVGSDSYSYDAAGNITDDGTREYVWDDAGRLKEVEISSTTVGAYTYNASSQRAAKFGHGVVTTYSACPLYSFLVPIFHKSYYQANAILLVDSILKCDIICKQ